MCWCPPSGGRPPPRTQVVCLTGSKESRAVILEHEMFTPAAEGGPRGRAGLQERVKFHVLLTSYEMVSLHAAELARITWGELVVDEGHRLKTKTSKLFQVGGGGWVAGWWVGG